MNLPEVVCVGAATVDSIALVDSVPSVDERVQAEVIVTAGGGPAATAAVTLARLGVPVAFCGVVGADEDGETVRAGLEHEGVDVRWLRVDSTVRTCRSLVLVERVSGARTIVTVGSAPIAPSDIPTVGRWLHVDQVGYAAAAQARLEGRRLSVDDGNRIKGLDFDGIDLYVPTARVLTARCGDDFEMAARLAHQRGAAMIVATDGARGAYLLSDGVFSHVPAKSVPVVSTLGAGDVFHGALLAGVVAGVDLKAAVSFAAHIAAESTRALDGRSAVPIGLSATGDCY